MSLCGVEAPVSLLQSGGVHSVWVVERAVTAGIHLRLGMGRFNYNYAETAVAFFQILTRWGRTIDRVAVLRPSGRYVGTRLDTTIPEDLMQSSSIGPTAGKSVRMPLCDGWVLSLNAASKQLMRERVRERYRGGETSYWRWAVSAEMCRSREPTWQLRGIAERMDTRNLEAWEAVGAGHQTAGR